MSTNDTVLQINVKEYFDSCGVDGSIAIYDLKKQQWIVSDTVEIKTETMPASTFKNINLLIALETKTIIDENEIVNWSAVQTQLNMNTDQIYYKMSVKEAFELSAGWIFIELAKKIGKKKYKEYLTKCSYGNNNLFKKETDFWNFGDFAISPK